MSAIIYTILYTLYIIIILPPWTLLLLSSAQYCIHYSISLSEKIEAKTERETILEEHFSIQQGEDTAQKTMEQAIYLCMDWEAW